MRIRLALFLALFGSLVLSSCKSGDSTTGPNSTQGTPTPIGTPIGSPSSATIDAAGGSLLSPDGRLELIVPAGALTQAVAISIQPVTNEAPLGAGSGFSLLPNGQQFAQPVTLRFHYAAGDLLGTDARALAVATQRDDRIWYSFRASTLDTLSSTLSVTTSHFSAYSMFKGFFVTPITAEVEVGKTQKLQVLYVNEGDKLDTASFIPLGDAGDIEGTSIGKDVSWTVNGIEGGSSNDGKVNPSAGSSTTTYTAPLDVNQMATNPVAVTAELTIAGLGKLMLISTIKVLDGKEYDFTVAYDATGLDVGGGVGASYNYSDQSAFHVSIGTDGSGAVTSIKNEPGRIVGSVKSPPGCTMTPGDSGDLLRIDSVEATEISGSFYLLIFSTRTDFAFTLDCGGGPISFPAMKSKNVFGTAKQIVVPIDGLAHTVTSEEYPHQVLTITAIPE